MQYYLICVQPFGKYAKGQMIYEEAEVNALSDDREHHFVRVPAEDQLFVVAPKVSDPKADQDMANAMANAKALTDKMAHDTAAIENTTAEDTAQQETDQKLAAERAAKG